MNRQGFQLTRLTLKGAGVPDAEVVFREGLNVVSGPSDTGKTFIFQCIDFMLGGQDSPKDIPEAAGYESVHLAIRPRGMSEDLVLERSLRGGDVRLYTPRAAMRVLRAKHKGEDHDTVSGFLLDLTGLTGKKVRTNAQGITRYLSFRDIARLTLVGEETIIREETPIFSGQVINKTVETAIFRLLLTGVDDSSVVTREDPKIASGRQKGKTEVIQTLSTDLHSQLQALNLTYNQSELDKQLERVNSLFELATAELEVDQQALDVLDGRHSEARAQLGEIESKLTVSSGLQNRFRLLMKQYESDLRRLESVAEAGTRLGQLPEVRCPVCGAPSEHHEEKHQSPHSTPGEVAAASAAEAQKIRTLIRDLSTTLSENAVKISKMETEQRSKKGALDVIKAEIKDGLKPRLRVTRQKLKDCQEQRDKFNKALELYLRLSELERMRIDIKTSSVPRGKGGITPDLGTHESEMFSQEVETILRAWRFPNLGRVTFSDKDHDLVISGRKRSSHGKGVRAITHAAFNLALLKYSIRTSMPHPGFVIVDSPLVVYREPDPNESGFSSDVKDAFFRSLALDHRSAQVIVFENEDPAPSLAAHANLIKFTGNEYGRRGFIPSRQAND